VLAHAEQIRQSVAVSATTSGAPLVVYRGQKTWDSSAPITAASFRRFPQGKSAVEWSGLLWSAIESMIAGAETGDAQAISDLENQLLTSQAIAFQNPFVSCTKSRAAALSFALAGDTPGVLLEITGDAAAGVDFEDLRRRLGMWSDSFDYLQEFGIPLRIESPFSVTAAYEVDLVGAPRRIH
jgi:hypothetical protein